MLNRRFKTKIKASGKNIKNSIQFSSIPFDEIFSSSLKAMKPAPMDVHKIKIKKKKVGMFVSYAHKDDDYIKLFPEKLED
jgi:hypothetical protein